ncbi:MAG TPA: hypothetical protein VHU13_04470 [Solirubrobacteraceae bacterium]|nr:hypothetical protein [Solirubrobacteraceae bacterium]
MTSVYAELGLVALAAMLLPTTLSFSVFAPVLGERPLRTGCWLYLWAFAATLAVGVAGALVLGDVAAAWLAFAVIALLPLLVALILLLLAREPTVRLLATVRHWLERHARTLAFAIVLLLAAVLLRNGIAGLDG